VGLALGWVCAAIGSRRDLCRELAFGGRRPLESRSGPRQPSTRPLELPGASRGRRLRRGNTFRPSEQRTPVGHQR